MIYRVGDLVARTANCRCCGVAGVEVHDATEDATEDATTFYDFCECRPIAHPMVHVCPGIAAARRAERVRIAESAQRLIDDITARAER
jgi:hypothetical protein